ncbi:MAG: hypothetical protein WAP23_01260 [Candidatus Spechtbacterales bacterium]
MARQIKIKARDNRPDLLSGEGIAMISVALMLDLIPPVFVIALDFFFGMGELISWPIDIFATIVLGGWMYMRGGNVSAGKKFTNLVKKRAVFFAAEFIPIVGEGPWHTINVFKFLKK